MSTTEHTSTPAAHLLIVDDDIEIVDLLRRYFDGHGYRISTATSAQTVHSCLERETIDLILLDLGLPDADGLDITRELRRHWKGALIIVSGRGDSVDRVVGLELGADDYVAKPFDLRELLARVRSVLRRATPMAIAVGASHTLSTTLEFAGFRLDLRARTLIRAGAGEIALTSGEFDLLRIFVEDPQSVISRDELMNRLHHRDAGPFDRAIDMQIARLRRKIESDPDQPMLLKAIRGVGYLLSAQVRRS